jgi:polar amino acid transport system substrate-binding protein
MIQKKKPKILLWIVSLTFFSSSALVPARADTILEEIDRTGLVKLGLREDAYPFAYIGGDNNFAGICIDIFNVIVNNIKQELNKDVLAIQLSKSTLANRFDLVGEKVIYLECGPNTISRQTNENIQFSQPFFVTGLQFLIRAADNKRINFNGNLANIRIGILRATATQSLISKKYPAATIQEFQGATGRRRGVQALSQRKIDAFASDSILLYGETSRQGAVVGRDYLLVPEQPLSCVYYGLILPQNDPQWQALINRSLNANQLAAIYRKWFGQTSPEIQKTQELCQEK